jgi:hypothetical protein
MSFGTLQDSLFAFIHAPDAWVKANLRTTYHAGDGGAGGGRGDGDGKGPPDGDPPADPPADDDLDNLGDDDKVDQAKLQKLIADRKEKNRRILEREQRIKEIEKELAEAKKAQAKLDEIERNNMSEAEKMKADNEKLLQQLEAERKAREKSDRLRLLGDNRVMPEYQDLIEPLLAKAQADAGDDFDAKKWFEEQQKTRAAVFADGEGDPLATGSGPPRSGNSAPVDKLRQEIKDLSSLQSPRQEDRTLLAIKRQELQRIENKQRGSGA